MQSFVEQASQDQEQAGITVRKEDGGRWGAGGRISNPEAVWTLCAQGRPKLSLKILC